MKKKLSAESRLLVKEQKGITDSEKKTKSCSKCYFYSSRRYCSKHYLITRSNEFCRDFSAKQIKVFRGGSTSSK